MLGRERVVYVGIPGRISSLDSDRLVTWDHFVDPSPDP